MKPIPSARRAAPFALSALLALCASAADVTIATSSDIAKQCYAVGDTVTVSGGDAAAVLGDGVAALAGQVLTMKHPGFTLLKDSGGTEYCFGVYETPGGAGDVFLFDWSANNVSWTSAAWANLTGNSERTFPDHADDVAMILNIVGNNYRYITVPPEGVTLGQLIVGTSLHFTLNHTGGSVTPLVFSRTDGAAPRICLSRPASSGTGDVHFRFGEYDSDNGGNVLAVSFAGPAFEVDFCGDTAASAAYARKGGLGFMFGRGKIAVGDGQTLILRNGSRLATDFVNVSRCRLGSGVFGAGTVEVRDVAFDFQSRTPDAYFDVGLFRSVEGFGPFDPADNNTSRYTTRFNAVPSVPVEILSARCPTNLNPHTRGSRRPSFSPAATTSCSRTAPTRRTGTSGIRRTKPRALRSAATSGSTDPSPTGATATRTRTASRKAASCTRSRSRTWSATTGGPRRRPTASTSTAATPTRTT